MVFKEGSCIPKAMPRWQRGSSGGALLNLFPAYLFLAQFHSCFDCNQKRMLLEATLSVVVLKYSLGEDR